LVYSVDQAVKPWQYHLTPETQRLYGYPLHSLAYAVLEAHKGHPSNYTFSMPPDHTSPIAELEACLGQAIMTNEHIQIFHNFIYPLLSAQSSIQEENKWSMVMECWLALYAMQPDGGFCNASHLTGVLAKMAYHCRAATFYEGYLHRKEFPKESLHT
jgi:hypothetical protein